MRTIEDVLNGLRAEFLEMPGLRLTLAQAQRLCGVEQMLGKMVLDTLIDERFLCLKPDGAYIRLTDGNVPRPHPAKAALRGEQRVATAS
jgi:hypothetical protein